MAINTSAWTGSDEVASRVIGDALRDSLRNSVVEESVPNTQANRDLMGARDAYIQEMLQRNYTLDNPWEMPIPTGVPPWLQGGRGGTGTTVTGAGGAGVSSRGAEHVSRMERIREELLRREMGLSPTVEVVHSDPGLVRPPKEIQYFLFDFERCRSGDRIVDHKGNDISQLFVFEMPPTDTAQGRRPIVALVQGLITWFDREGRSSSSARLYMKYRTSEEEFC